MTRGERIRQIMREEREATGEAIAASPLPDPVKSDAVDVFMAIQAAINAWIGGQDRTIDHRVMQAACRLMAGELERVYARLSAEGLTAESEPPPEEPAL